MKRVECLLRTRQTGTVWALDRTGLGYRCDRDPPSTNDRASMAGMVELNLFDFVLLEVIGYGGCDLSGLILGEYRVPTIGTTLGT